MSDRTVETVGGPKRRAQSFEYRGYHIDRIDTPSKNWRIGNILTFWRIREFQEAGELFSMFNSRPEAKRAVDARIDAVTV